jgi:hypothetical protein
VHTQPVSVAELHPWDWAPSIKHFEAQADIPVTLVSVAAAEDVVDGSVDPVEASWVCETLSVWLEESEVGVTEGAVELDAPSQVDD